MFAQATRQTYQTLPSKNFESENSTIQINLPKARLLSKVVLEVEAVATLKSTAGTIKLDPFSPHGMIRQVAINLNNGFSPFIVSGKELFIHSLNRLNPQTLQASGDVRSCNYVENKASASGVDNKIKFRMELPVTLNDRDTMGLILLQNEETSVDVVLDLGQVKDAYQLTTGNSDEVIFKSVKVTPLVETFTIPPAEIARPDLSVLKLVQSKRESFNGNGQSTIKLNTGTIYRKAAFYFEDDNGQPLSDDDFLANFELIFNTADVPISIKPSILSAKNAAELGYTLPKGVFIFDWSYQGIPNLGGTRDYIDTERLTEFWLRFTATKNGKVTVISETLSRLRTQ